VINEALVSPFVHNAYIRTTHAGRHDAYDDISCVLHRRNASIFVSEAEVAIKHERGIALYQDEYALTIAALGQTYCVGW